MLRLHPKWLKRDIFTVEPRKDGCCDPVERKLTCCQDRGGEIHAKVSWERRRLAADYKFYLLGSIISDSGKKFGLIRVMKDDHETFRPSRHTQIDISLVVVRICRYLLNGDTGIGMTIKSVYSSFDLRPLCIVH